MGILIYSHNNFIYSKQYFLILKNKNQVLSSKK